MECTLELWNFVLYFPCVEYALVLWNFVLYFSVFKTRSSIMEICVIYFRVWRAAVYPVALIQSRGSLLVITPRTADVRVMSDRPVTQTLVPVELSTSISSSHAAMYVVN